MKDLVSYLKQMGCLLREDVMTTVHLAGDGHPGPALSVADIISALYFNILNVDSGNPHWPQRDRLILSKGHSCPVVYAALARRGFFSIDLLPSLRSLDSILQGHPDMNKTPGIDMTTGSLGNGLSIGLGMAAAGRYMGYDYTTYVVMGDGELEEGIVWEAAMAAVHMKTNKIIVFIDNNNLQSGGILESVSGVNPIYPKWMAFGWHCQEIDGHDYEQILNSVEIAKGVSDKPSVILAHTIKGKGVPFMEGDNSWHKRVPTKKELEDAIIALRGALK